MEAVMGYGSGLPAFIPRLTYQANPQVERVLRHHGPSSSVVVDLGAGGRRVAPHVITVDFMPSRETDCVADLCRTPFKTSSVDLVIATGVLEHVEDDRLVLEEIRRILRPGGVVHIEVPFLQQYHEDPIDCRRYTRPGLAKLLEQYGFVPQQVGCHIGPTVTVLTLLSYYAAVIFDGRSIISKIFSNAAFAAVSVIGWPFKFLDYWIISRPTAHRLAFGVYCTAKRL